jgi:hypothetical protein
MPSPYRLGDIREDGKRFVCFNRSRGKEVWASPKSYELLRFNVAYQNAKKRALKKKVPFAITVDYLRDIFPEDGLCPVLRIPLNWGKKTGSQDSPSLDRIIPQLGYVEDNLIWVSELVNRVKSDASPDILIKVGQFYKKLH